MKIRIIFLICSVGFLFGFPLSTISSVGVGVWTVAAQDFNMNFDNFAKGTVSPFPFKSISNGGGSFGNITGVVFAWSSAPNVYQMKTGSSRQNVSLQATFNATAYKMVSHIQANCIDGYTTGAQLSLTLVSSQQTNSTKLNSGSGGCVGGNGSFTLNSTVTTTPGSSVTFKLNWTAIAAGGSSSFIFLDNFQILFGAIIVPNYNFQLFNASSASPNWFDPSTVPGSQLVLNFSSGPVNNSANWQNAPPQGLIFPDVNYTSSLGTAKLITFYFGNIYFRTLIPTAHTNMYIDNPASVFQFTVNILSPGLFGQGDRIWISQGTRNITSGYLDSVSSFVAYLVPGLYSIKLISASGRTFIDNQNFPASNSQINVNAFSVTITNTAGVVTSVMWTLGWNSTNTGIVLAYSDATNTTTQLFLQLKSINTTGTFLKFSKTYSVSGCHGFGCLQSFTVVIPANSPGFNSTTEIVGFLFTTNFLGTNATLGQQQISCQGCVASLNLPILPFGLTLLGGLNVLSMVAYSVIVLSGAGFGNYFGPFGFLVVAGETGFFAFFGWLPVSLLTIATVFIALAVTGLMWRHERTP